MENNFNYCIITAISLITVFRNLYNPTNLSLNGYCIVDNAIIIVSMTSS